MADAAALRIDDRPADWQAVNASARAGGIVIVLTGLSVAGGSERIVNFIANHWAGQGRRTTVVTFDSPDMPSYYPYDSRVSIRRLALPPQKRGPVGGLWASLQRILLLRRTLRELSPAVVVSFLTRTNVLTMIATRGLGIPVVVSERNNPEVQTFGPVWSRLRALLYPRAFGLVTMTKGALRYFPEKQRPRGWVIPNPADLPAVDHPRREGRVLGAVGRLVPQKGFDLLLQAFARIASEFPDWRLTIWGEGPERKSLEDLRDSLGLTKQVSLPGVTEQPGGWIAQTDMFVLSSRFEGWGIVLLEAMAAGLPVVSFNCEWGPADMIDHDVNGLLVPPENVLALATVLRRVMADARLRERLSTAARHSTRRFSPERIAANWDEVIDAALTRPAHIMEGVR